MSTPLQKLMKKIKKTLNSPIIFKKCRNTGIISLRVRKTKYGSLELLECIEPGILRWRTLASNKSAIKCVFRYSQKPGERDLLIAVLNIHDLYTEYKNKIYAPKNIWNLFFSTVSKTYLELTSEIYISSHVIVLAWISKIPEKHTKEGVDSYQYDLEVLDCCSCYVESNSQARLLTSKLIHLLITLWKPSLQLSWFELVFTINLKQWLQNIGKSLFGEEYELQPPKWD